MASIINGLIERVQIDNGTVQSLASTAYGVCTTGANVAAKVVDMTGFNLVDGVTVHIKFENENTATSPTLNINNTGAKSIVLYGSTATGNDDYTTGWKAGSILTLTYDGTNWVRNQSYNELNVPNVIAKTTAQWRDTLTYIPPKDTILIYLDRGTITVNEVTYDVPGIKIGDGLAYGIDLPFVGDDVKEYILDQLETHTSNTTIHITGAERTFWNNKLNCDINGELLILNRS